VRPGYQLDAEGDGLLSRHEIAALMREAVEQLGPWMAAAGRGRTLTHAWMRWSAGRRALTR
jgi:hypothetical protein